MLETAAILALALHPATRARPAQPAVIKLLIAAPAPLPVAKPLPPPRPASPPAPPPPVSPPAAPAPTPPPRPATHPRARLPPHPPRHAVRVMAQPPLPAAPPAPAMPALPPAPVPAAPPPSPRVAQTLLARYTSMLRGILLGNLADPEELADTDQSGTCTLRFVVTPSGAVEDVAVLEPSGIEAVNQAALAALRQSVFPAFLANMPGHALTFTIRVHVGSD